MIGFETLCFMKHLDELAKLAQNGIKPFSEATAENQEMFVFYDDTKEGSEFPVVLQMHVNDLHHDIVSYDDGDNYRVLVSMQEDGTPMLYVAGYKSFAHYECNVDYYIDFTNGSWTFS